jgi:RNA polymerase sigma-70 factor (ECF subfamily)
VTAPKEDESEVYAAIAEVLRGQVDAFAVIVRTYQPLIYRLALSYLGGAEDAQDAAQEIFARVYRALDRYRLGSRFHPWLYTIALNELRTRRGRLQLARSRRAPGKDTEDLEDARQEDVTAGDTRRRIREAVGALPRDLRDVVVLYYLEGMETAEVAEVLGLGRENVKSRLHRARGRLRSLLVGE